MLEEYGHAIVELLANCCMLLEICNIFYTFGWASMHLDNIRVDAWQWAFLEHLTTFAVLSFMLHRLYRFAYTSVFPVTIVDVFDVIAIAIMLSVQVHWCSQSGFEGPTGAQQVLRACLAAWRAAQYYFASWVQRHDSSDSHNTNAKEILQNTRFNFLWLVQTVDFFLGYVPSSSRSMSG